MKIAIMQPYLFPYIGYFQLISAVEIFVVYDDVNFIKKGYINRNSLLVSGIAHQFTFPIIGVSQNKKINELEFENRSDKFIKMLITSYSKAPFFRQVFQLVQKILVFEKNNVSDFLANSLIEICEYLQIKTKILVSSKLEIESNRKSSRRIIEICQNLKASEYINSIGGQSLYDKDDFNQHNIKLHFLKSEMVEYNQNNNAFVPWLSIIDIMMFNDVKAVQQQLKNYSLK